MPARDPRTRRYPCAWCAEDGMWPDLCSEALGRLDDRCAAMIEIQCGLGDHRRCLPSACASAARWHEPVRRAGVEAAHAAGAVWAVVSTLENRITVVGTEDHLGRAKSLLRNGALKRAGSPTGPEGKGLVYVVRGADGRFF